MFTCKKVIPELAFYGVCILAWSLMFRILIIKHMVSQVRLGVGNEPCLFLPTKNKDLKVLSVSRKHYILVFIGELLKLACGSFVLFMSCVCHAFAAVHCCLVVT